MDTTQNERVERAWHRITTWCERCAPGTAATLRPSAGEQVVGAAERATGVMWPLELKHWYSLHDGVDFHDSDGEFLLGFMPTSLETLLQRHAWMVKLWADRPTRDNRTRKQLIAEPAGTPAGVYLPCYLPIGALMDASSLVLDARRGTLAGAVREFDETKADGTGAPPWSSLAELLEDVAGTLEQGRASKNRQVHRIVLQWKVP